LPNQLDSWQTGLSLPPVADYRSPQLICNHMHIGPVRKTISQRDDPSSVIAWLITMTTAESSPELVTPSSGMAAAQPEVVEPARSGSTSSSSENPPSATDANNKINRPARSTKGCLVRHVGASDLAYCWLTRRHVAHAKYAATSASPFARNAPSRSAMYAHDCNHNSLIARAEASSVDGQTRTRPSLAGI
jgi:hypothetical protein